MVADEDGMQGTRGSRPVPDPTALTTEALRREISGVKELFRERFDARDLLYEAKLEAVYAAIVANAELAKAQVKASETAISKTERSVEDRLRELTTLFRSETGGLAERIRSEASALDDKIQSNLRRLDTFEARSSGAIDARSSAQDTQKLWLAVIGTILTMAILFLGVMTFVNRSSSQPEVRVIERAGPSTVIERPNQVVVPDNGSR